MLAGLLIGAGVAFAMGQLKSSFNTAERLERAIDLPVIGTISRARTVEAERLQKQRTRQFAMGLGGLAGLCALLLIVSLVQVGSVV